MFVEKFIKKIYISFYKDKNYKMYYEVIKNKKLVESAKKEFESKDELIRDIENFIDDYPQTYISTIITSSLNQGVIPSCDKKEYKKREIDLDNIKYICIKNRYSIYVSLYDLVSIKKEFSFEIDFLYSIFAPIDFFAKKRDNYFYVLILNEKIAILGYKDNIPIFSDIFEYKNSIEEENEEIEDDIELLEDIDLDLDEISENIEEEAENLDIQENENSSNIILSTNEQNIILHLKEAIKEYYANYSDDFLEKIIYLDTINIGTDIKKLTEDELLLDSEIIKFDLLKTLNQISEMENV